MAPMGERSPLKFNCSPRLASNCDAFSPLSESRPQNIDDPIARAVQCIALGIHLHASPTARRCSYLEFHCLIDLTLHFLDID